MDGLRRTAVRSRFSSCAATRPREGAAAGPCDVCGPGEGRGDEYCSQRHCMLCAAWRGCGRRSALARRRPAVGDKSEVPAPRQLICTVDVVECGVVVSVRTGGPRVRGSGGVTVYNG